MIPKANVNEFLDQKRDSHVWMKRLTHRQLDEAIAKITPKPNLYPKMRLHQKVCFLLGVAYRAFGYWLDMGTGKTLLSLQLIQYFYDIGLIKRWVVFVLSDTAYDTWERQIKEYKITVPYLFLEDSSEHRWRQLEEFENGIVIVAYPSAVAMTTAWEKVKGKKKGRWVLHDKLVRHFSKHADGIIMDESTRAGHYDSLTHRLIERLCKTSQARFALAGLPFGRDPTLLWGQHKLIDGGESLGETLGIFREAFFSAEQNKFSTNKYAKDFKFKKTMKGTLSKLAQHRSITYATDECIDLPKLIPIIEGVKFSKEAYDYYKNAVKQLIAAKGNFREMKNAFLRMRQLSSGFIGFKDDETGVKAEIEFPINPKLDLLLELLEDLPAGRKAVVFYDFTFSGRLMHQKLTELKFDPIWLWSGTKDSRREIGRYLDTDKPRVAILQNQLGAFSLDGLQKVANYTFFYESPVPVITRKQAERRLLRDGQDHTVFQYDLIMRNSADEKILAFHKEGHDLFKAVLRNPKVLDVK